MPGWPERLLLFAVAVPAIVLHELAHGYAALVLGDTTARDAGRLSANPLRHIHPVGTLLVPALLAALGSPIVVGFARRVPVTPFAFRDYRRGMLLTALAGPAANAALAALAGLVVRAALTADPMPLTLGIARAAYLFAEVNLVLAAFNLLPVPPLDGSHANDAFLGDAGLARLERYGPYVGTAVIALLALGAPLLLGVDVIGRYLAGTALPLLHLLTGA